MISKRFFLNSVRPAEECGRWERPANPRLHLERRGAENPSEGSTTSSLELLVFMCRTDPNCMLTARGFCGGPLGENEPKKHKALDVQWSKKDCQLWCVILRLVRDPMGRGKLQRWWYISFFLAVSAIAATCAKKIKCDTSYLSSLWGFGDIFYPLLCVCVP